MQAIFESINNIFSFIGPLSDFLWDFPTNFEWYANIPILGNFSFAIILLVGSGIFFSFRLDFIQITHFKKGIQIMTEKRTVQTGISPLAAFLLSSAMRVGPGNILGVTGAIAVGGPGALFWMWISAFFGMSVAYMEAVLAQILKRKRMMNLSVDFLSMAENCLGIRYGWEYSFLCFIFCMPFVVCQHRDLTWFLRLEQWQKL